MTHSNDFTRASQSRWLRPREEDTYLSLKPWWLRSLTCEIRFLDVYDTVMNREANVFKWTTKINVSTLLTVIYFFKEKLPWKTEHSNCQLSKLQATATRFKAEKPAVLWTQMSLNLLRSLHRKVMFRLKTYESQSQAVRCVSWYWINVRVRY